MKFTFSEFVQKNIRRKDKNVKQIDTRITALTDITDKVSSMDDIIELETSNEPEYLQKAAINPKVQNPFKFED